MRRSIQSVMTAAMFAASLGTAMNNSGFIYSAGAETGVTPASETSVDTVPQTTYGPPVWRETEETENPDELLRTAGVAPIQSDDEYLRTAGEATVETDDLMPEGTAPVTTTTTTCLQLDGTYPVEEIPTTTTFTLPVVEPLYGPPWVLFSPSDVNTDGQTDVRDLTLLKRAILENYDRSGFIGGNQMGDINGDGTVDKEDIKELMRQMNNGKDPQNKQEPVVTTTTAAVTTTNQIVSSIMDESDRIPQPVYGPPSMENEMQYASQMKADSNKTTTTTTVRN